MEGPQSCLSPFPLLAALLLFSIIFSLGDLEGGSAGVGVMGVRCRCGDAFLLAPNVTILNGHLGDLCSCLFSEQWSRKS